MANTIRFRLKQNVLIDLGDDKLHQPPMRTIEIETNIGPALVANFDMDHVFETSFLPGETPAQVEREDGMSQPFYDKLLDQSFEAAVKVRTANAERRERLRLYAERGIIELLDPIDPQPAKKGKA